jgi:hypothetical protein
VLKNIGRESQAYSPVPMGPIAHTTFFGLRWPLLPHKPG